MTVNRQLQSYIYLTKKHPYTSVRYFSLLNLVSNNKSYEVIKLYNNFPVYAWGYNDQYFS